MIRKLIGALVALLLAVAAAPASAQDLSGEAGERPWAKGVSPQDQERATELFKRGNDLLKDSIFVQAAATYREALKHWDHPAIHYNLVLALLNLDQPLEVYEHLEAALRFGPAPLDADKYEQAKGYKILVEKQLVKVVIKCEEPGALVKLDGQPLFTAPGEHQGWVRAGAHTIIASKEGFIPHEVSQPLPAGETVEILLEVKPGATVEYRRRWNNWIPWSVVGAGVLVAAGGAGLHVTGMAAVETYDQEIESCGGCVPSPDVADLRDSGARLQGIAVGAYAVGGAALVTGAVLLYMNRLQPVTPGVVEKTAEEDAGETVHLAPMLGGDRGVGLSAGIGF